MTDWNDRNQKDDNEVKKSLDYDTCPQHGIRYPSGGDCPACVRERNERS